MSGYLENLKCESVQNASPLIGIEREQTKRNRFKYSFEIKPIIGVIYKVTNLINGKSYIGKRCANREVFLKSNYYGSGLYINKTIKKYGIQQFKKEVIDECCSKEELNQREIHWIEKLNSIRPNGYNLTIGGDGGKTSEKAFGKIKKPIISINIETGKKIKYESVQQTKLSGFDPDKVSNCCLKHRTLHKGHIFFYENDKNKEIVINTSTQLITIKNKKTKKYQYFDSIISAAKTLILDPYLIQTILKNKDIFKKYNFEYTIERLAHRKKIPLRYINKKDNMFKTKITKQLS